MPKRTQIQALLRRLTPDRSHSRNPPIPSRRRTGLPAPPGVADAEVSVTATARMHAVDCRSECRLQKQKSTMNGSDRSSRRVAASRQSLVVGHVPIAQAEIAVILVAALSPKHSRARESRARQMTNGIVGPAVADARL